MRRRAWQRRKRLLLAVVTAATVAAPVPTADGHARRNGSGPHANRILAPTKGDRNRPAKPATANQVRAIVTIARRQRADLDGVLVAKRINKQSRTQLRRLLEAGGVVSTLLNTPNSVATLTTIRPQEIWVAVAHRIWRLR